MRISDWSSDVCSSDRRGRDGRRQCDAVLREQIADEKVSPVGHEVQAGNVADHIAAEARAAAPDDVVAGAEREAVLPLHVEGVEREAAAVILDLAGAVVVIGLGLERGPGRRAMAPAGTGGRGVGEGGGEWGIDGGWPRQ